MAGWPRYRRGGRFRSGANRPWAPSCLAIMSLTSASSGVSGRRMSSRRAGTSGVFEGEPGQPLAQMLPVSRDYLAMLQLPAAGVQVLEGQLAAVHFECAYDAYEGPL